MRRVEIQFLIGLLLLSINISQSQKPKKLQCEDNFLGSVISNLQAPAGYQIHPYYCGEIVGARSLAVSKSKNDGATIVYVSTRLREIYALVDTNSDGTAEQLVLLADDLSFPVGIAWYKGSLFVAEEQRILRFDDVDTYALSNESLPKPKVIFDKLPAQDEHFWRYLALGPDKKLYVTIGAPCNACTTKPVKGIQQSSIYRMDPDGKNVELVARGVRNSMGMDWQPSTDVMFFTDNAMDGVGNNNPDDELNYLVDVGSDYGFPFCNTQGLGEPNTRGLGVGAPIEGPEPDYSNEICAGPGRYSEPAVQALGPHKASLGMEFYKGKMFPANMDGVALIANHGSWNRHIKIGYDIAAVKLDGNTTTDHQIFISGFLQPQTSVDPDASSVGEVIGRPVDLEVIKDGSLLISDDLLGAVYRVIYTGSDDISALLSDDSLPQISLAPGESLGLTRATAYDIAPAPGPAAELYFPTPKGGPEEVPDDTETTPVPDPDEPAAQEPESDAPESLDRSILFPAQGPSPSDNPRGLLPPSIEALQTPMAAPEDDTDEEEKAPRKVKDDDKDKKPKKRKKQKTKAPEAEELEEDDIEDDAFGIAPTPAEELPSDGFLPSTPGSSQRRGDDAGTSRQGEPDVFNFEYDFNDDKGGSSMNKLGLLVVSGVVALVLCLVTL